MVNKTNLMTYTFLHAFKDSSVGIAVFKTHPWMEYTQPINIHADVPPEKGKRWRNEFSRWVEEIVLPFLCQSPNPISIDFNFVQQ